MEGTWLSFFLPYVCNPSLPVFLLSSILVHPELSRLVFCTFLTLPRTDLQTPPISRNRHFLTFHCPLLKTLQSLLLCEVVFHQLPAFASLLRRRKRIYLCVSQLQQLPLNLVHCPFLSCCLNLTLCLLLFLLLPLLFLPHISISLQMWRLMMEMKARVIMIGDLR